jgi:hypothetical protein
MMFIISRSRLLKVSVFGIVDSPGSARFPTRAENLAVVTGFGNEGLRWTQFVHNGALRAMAAALMAAARDGGCADGGFAEAAFADGPARPAFLPSAILHPPSAILHPPSAILHPPSAICHLPSAIRRLPSAIRHPRARASARA